MLLTVVAGKQIKSSNESCFGKISQLMSVFILTKDAKENQGHVPYLQGLIERAKDTFSLRLNNQ